MGWLVLLLTVLVLDRHGEGRRGRWVGRREVRLREGGSSNSQAGDGNLCTSWQDFMAEGVEGTISKRKQPPATAEEVQAEH